MKPRYLNWDYCQTIRLAGGGMYVSVWAAIARASELGLRRAPITVGNLHVADTL